MIHQMTMRTIADFFEPPAQSRSPVAPKRAFTLERGDQLSAGKGALAESPGPGGPAAKVDPRARLGAKALVESTRTACARSLPIAEKALSNSAAKGAAMG
jgi:hypothetical protein